MESAAQQRFLRALVGLLAAAIFIHALDRGNLATAAPLIKDELNLSNVQIGILTSAFFWVYVPGQLLAGLLIQRINAYRTLLLGVAIWSVATLLTGFAAGYATILGLRLLLALGECAGFPASSKLLAQNLSPVRLGAANAWVSAGLMLGNGAGTLLGGLLISRLGWRAIFFAFGALSIAWLVPWVKTIRLAPAWIVRSIIQRTESICTRRSSDAPPNRSAIWANVAG